MPEDYTGFRVSSYDECLNDAVTSTAGPTAMPVVAVRFHETRKCPPGSIAWHATLGFVDVLQARGWERVVRIGRPAPGADEVADVDVRELELIDADGDVGVALAQPLERHEFRSLVEADEAELAELRAWEAERPAPAPRGRGGRRG
jgi:hypothetical protein